MCTVISPIMFKSTGEPPANSNSPGKREMVRVNEGLMSNFNYFVNNYHPCKINSHPGVHLVCFIWFFYKNVSFKKFS